MDNNKLSEIPEEVFRTLTSINTLKLRGNFLKRLPDSTFHLTQLRILDVSSNRLTTLSPKVSLLTHLNRLNIQDNRLDALPNSLSFMERLDSVSSEFFIYLDTSQEMILPLKFETGDVDLDWIT